jgi:hypothetical protein
MRPPVGKDLIAAALLKTASDPGAMFEKDVLGAARAIRAADPAEYQRIRAKARKAGCKIDEFDRLTLPQSGADPKQLFDDVVPWPDPVDGAALLTDIRAVLQRHVIADKPVLTATVLWVLHSWCMDVFNVSPLAHISAPEKRCGKTILLTAMSRLCYRAMPASNISSAALYRVVERWRPTLLIDEVDSFLHGNEVARGLLDGGLTPDMAYSIRCDGDDHEIKQFSTWAAKALCGIGRLASTLEDRSIPLRLRRKIAGEQVESIHRSDPSVWENLQRRIARWTQDNKERLGKTRPGSIPGLNDRAQDCWEPLLSIAEVAGGEWPDEARSAAVALHGVEDQSSSAGVELLAAIMGIFENKGVDRMASCNLLAALVEDEEAPWATWNHGSQMSFHQLGKKLRGFGISSATMRLANGDRLKGYTLDSFRDAFSRYLPSDHGMSKRDSVTSASECGFQPVPKRDMDAHVTDRDTTETALQSHCHDVTGQKPLQDEEGIEVVEL